MTCSRALIMYVCKLLNIMINTGPTIISSRDAPQSVVKRAVKPWHSKHASTLRPNNAGTGPSPRICVQKLLKIARSLHSLMTIVIVSTIRCCMCRVGPPPLHFEALYQQDCQGDIDHWHWDRCALPGSVIWSALYFGHRQKSEFHLSKVACTFDLLTLSDLSNCRNSLDARRLIMLAQNRSLMLSSGELNTYQVSRCSSPKCQPQYTPFNVEHPFLLSTQPILPLADGSLNLLPPVTLSLFIENNDSISEWSWWQPSLKFSLAILNCAEGAAPHHEWNASTASFPGNFRCCQDCPHNHFATDMLRLHANTEYLLDNIFLDAFTLQQLSQLDSIPCSPFRISVSANLLPSESWSHDDFPNDAHADIPINWHHQFHAVTQRVSKVESSRLVRRRSAKAISHKLCQTVASYPNCKSGCFQKYDANTHTVSTSFAFENNRFVSVVVIAASVKHTENGRAVFEALVWAEFDRKCGTDATFVHHCVGQKLELAITCNVAGTTAPGVITQDIVTRTYREAVISCDFHSDLFKRTVGEVLVALSDTTKGFNMVLPMCSLAKDTAVRKLVACSQPIYNARYLETRWPGVLQAWVLYHINHLGFDHFTLYDSDGSAAPFVAPLLDRYVSFSYFPNWAATSCTATVAHSSPYCSETLMENHCMWNARGAAEWVMLIHAPDCFVNDSPGSPALLELLDSLDQGVSSLLLPTFVFENPDIYKYVNVTAADIFGLFTKRRCPMLLASRHMPIFDPHDVSVAFVHEELTASGLRQYTAAIAVHHYFQLFSSRASENLEWSAYDGQVIPYCEDSSMAAIGPVVHDFLQELASSA